MVTNGNAKKARTDASASTGSSVGASDWVGPRSDDPTPILYFSGTRRWSKLGLGEPDLAKDTGWKYRCLSYFYLTAPEAKTGETIEAWGHIQQQKGVRCFLDSGAHSFLAGTKAQLSQQNLQRYLADYAAWVRASPFPWDFTVNFDYKKNAPECYRVLGELNELRVKPIPVFHGDSTLDWIKRYHDDGHQLIGLGKPGRFRHGGKFLRQQFYGEVFNLTERLGMKVHGFAVSGSNSFFYPWYSLDSTTWLRAAVRGAIVYYDPDRRFLTLYHVSRERLSNPSGSERIHHLNPKVLAALKERLELQGVSLKKLQHSSYWRCVYNVRAQLQAVCRSKERSHGLHTWAPIF